MYIAEQRGIALITVMMLALILTVLGIAAISVSGWERRVAGLSATTGAAASAAESCIGTSVNVIKQGIDLNVSTFALPAAVLSNAVPPGPVPVGNAAFLFSEIKGQAPGGNNNPDVPVGTGAAPNIVQTVNNYAVAGDIDQMWVAQNAGAGNAAGAGYEGFGQGSASTVYRIDCVATDVITGTTSRITAVYYCYQGSGGCEAENF